MYSACLVVYRVSTVGGNYNYCCGSKTYVMQLPIVT